MEYDEKRANITGIIYAAAPLSLDGRWELRERNQEGAGQNGHLLGKSKTAPTEEEREQARKEYLDRRGVLESFRW